MRNSLRLEPRLQLELVGCKVNLSPSAKEMQEIYDWLMLEWNDTMDGFFCNWNVVLSAIAKSEFAVILKNKKCVGFIAWRTTSTLTAKIEIMEIHPNFRSMGLGQELANAAIGFIKGKNVSRIELESTSKRSEQFWRTIGFVYAPEEAQSEVSYAYRKRVLLLHL